MCNKPNKRGIDPCMNRLINFINTHPSVKTLASCCGHGKYSMSIVIKYKDTTVSRDGTKQRNVWKKREMLSGIELKHKSRFYVKDNQGFYFIPEVTDRLIRPTTL